MDASSVIQVDSLCSSSKAPLESFPVQTGRLLAALCDRRRSLGKRWPLHGGQWSLAVPSIHIRFSSCRANGEKHHRGSRYCSSWRGQDTVREFLQGAGKDIHNCATKWPTEASASYL